MPISKDSLIFVLSALKSFKTEKNEVVFSINGTNEDHLSKVVDLEGIQLRGVIFNVNIQFFFCRVIYS